MTGPGSGLSGRVEPGNASPAAPDTTNPLRGSEPGPLIVVLGYLAPEDADRLAADDAAKFGGTAARIGLGVQLPAGPFGLRFDTWLHVYATTQPTRLAAALSAVEEERPDPLVVVAESADGDLLFDPSTGSCVMPAHWTGDAS